MGKAALKIEAQGEFLSVSQIAKRLKIDRSVCRNRLDDLGYEPDPQHRSSANHAAYWFDDEMEFAIKSAKDSLAAAKIRGMRAKTALDELKLDEARGVLVPMGEAVEIMQRVVKTVYEEYTTRQPKRIATKLAKATNVTTVKQILKADNARIMKSLRANFEQFIA